MIIFIVAGSDVVIIITALLMESNNGGNMAASWVYHREIRRNVFTGFRLQALYSGVQHNNLYNTGWRYSAKKCSSVLATPNMVVVHGRLHISFMLIQKTKYYVTNQECQLLFFRICEISGAEHLLGKQFHGIQVRAYHVIYSSSLCPSITNVS